MTEKFCPMNSMKPCIKEECAWFIQGDEENGIFWDCCAVYAIPIMVEELTSGIEKALDKL